MKVYIVFCGINYEGADVHSVYTTREAADTVRASLDEHCASHCDYHTVEEHEVKNGTN